MGPPIAAERRAAYEQASGESSWEKPAGWREQDVRLLCCLRLCADALFLFGQEWDVNVDADSGRKYFVNKRTSESR